MRWRFTQLWGKERVAYTKHRFVASRSLPERMCGFFIRKAFPASAAIARLETCAYEKPHAFCLQAAASNGYFVRRSSPIVPAVEASQFSKPQLSPPKSCSGTRQQRVASTRSSLGRGLGAARRLTPDVISFNSLLHGCAFHGRWTWALGLLGVLEMQVNQISRSLASCRVCLVRASCRAGLAMKGLLEESSLEWTRNNIVCYCRPCVFKWQEPRKALARLGACNRVCWLVGSGRVGQAQDLPAFYFSVAFGISGLAGGDFMKLCCGF